MSSRFSSVGIPAAVVLATVTVAACASSPHSLEQVEASNPSTTYEYRGDEELLQAQQNAVAFCRQYQSAPRPARFAEARDGGTEVVFECDPNLPAAVSPQQASAANLTYSYRTDQELLDASRSAQTYCMVSGSQVAISNISTHTDGSRTVTFQCTPRVTWIAGHSRPQPAPTPSTGVAPMEAGGRFDMDQYPMTVSVG